MNSRTWSNRSVFVTGHTGFKGGWLSLWLHHLGAQVHGYALNPPTEPNLFEVARVSELLTTDTRANVTDLDELQSSLKRVQPEVVFHLAAQPLVRESYRNPLNTLTTNVMGATHLMEAIRNVESVLAVVIITTDKVYENREWVYPYRETDTLGGYDPYSASKAAAEIVVASYRASFFGEGTAKPLVHIATARAGNVIGGGDWSSDRLVPDCLKAFERAESVYLRYPHAVRPWQHVLEPLSGYLLLAERLLGTDASRYTSSWNFGPDTNGDATVAEVAQALANLWGKSDRVKLAHEVEHPHETCLLRLDTTRARKELGWYPRWSLQQALQSTVEWHQTWISGENMGAKCLEQIRNYEDS